MLLPRYDGRYPAAQELMELRVHNCAVSAGSGLASRQVAAVLRVLVDEIEELRGEVERLRRKKGGA